MLKNKGDVPYKENCRYAQKEKALNYINCLLSFVQEAVDDYVKLTCVYTSSLINAITLPTMATMPFSAAALSVTPVAVPQTSAKAALAAFTTAL